METTERRNRSSLTIETPVETGGPPKDLAPGAVAGTMCSAQ